MAGYLLILLCVAGALSEPTIYFQEDFDKGIEDRWVHSTHRGAEQGKFVSSHGKYYGDAVRDLGIQTSEDARFYGLSTKFDEPFTNENKGLVIQFIVKHEQDIDCGGGYIKILGSDFDPKSFYGETPYKIMFGPDVCGMSKKVHVIINYKGENRLIKKEIQPKDGVLSHLYTLILKPDNTYEVLIDNEKAESGDLESDWNFLPDKKIKDPNAKKPDDWDEREMIDDPEDKKPSDWDKPKHVPDPNAKKPDDWDDEMDGEWEPAQIENPEYKGEWKPKQIANPKYSGKWEHPLIDNPDYTPDPRLYVQKDMGGVGFDLWQVKSGTIFDAILITDDAEYAKNQGEEKWRPRHDAEKKLKEKADEEELAKMKAEKEKEEKEKKEKEKEKGEESDETKDKDEGVKETKEEEKEEL